MRIYVIAAYPAVRAGLAALVREQREWQVVGQSAGNGPVAAALNQPLDAPDVVLADLDGLASADTDAMGSWLDTLRPHGGIVAVGPARGGPARGDASGEAIRLFADAARAASDRNLGFGALRRDATADEIVAAVTAVAGGLIALDRRVAADLLISPERATLAAERLPGTGDETLTARELEVLQLLAQGLPNKLIAQRLHISEHTAKFHVSAIMTKLNAASRTEAVTVAARRGLLIL